MTTVSASASASSSSQGYSSMAHMLFVAAWSAGCLHVVYLVIIKAYTLRLHAINEYGLIIHEFDPYFNFRATEYLWDHGAKAFFEWFDYMVWYPLGRPVGTTIYPGMQFTSVYIKRYLLPDMSLNDICCYVPAWFGAIASILTGLIAYECSLGSYDNNDSTPFQPFECVLRRVPVLGTLYHYLLKVPLDFVLRQVNRWGAEDLECGGLVMHARVARESRTHALSSPAVECGLAAAAIMSMVPAHLMRSVGGGYDNESVAVTAMTLTFWLWVKSLAGGFAPRVWTYVYALAAGLAYFYMAATWGGYVFVINLVGAHAGFLVVVCGRYSSKLHRAYSLFYVVGTALAMQVPVVGWAPLKSLEQLGPAGVFVLLQLLEICHVVEQRKQWSKRQRWNFRFAVFGSALVVAAGVVALLWPTGYFGPISSRVRGLFVKHTKTGNPLVDSVAEHQPASTEAYFQYLHNVCYLAPVGLALVLLNHSHDASLFLVVYGVAAYFFSNKMVRLVLLTAPIASILAGICIGRFLAGWTLRSLLPLSWKIMPITMLFPFLSPDEQEGGEGGGADTVSDKHAATTTTNTDTKKKRKKKGGASSKDETTEETTSDKKPKLTAAADSSGSSTAPTSSTLSLVMFVVFRLIRLAAAAWLLREAYPKVLDFYRTCESMSSQLSHPTILFKGETKAGEIIVVDDYREAYWWLRDNTPPDARIMAWWDYGYQITAIANRTTLADGNTWNHEHIALLGRALTSPEKEGHRIARHLADYILLWAGGGGDDVAKSPHLARIANSVYRHMCPNDPTCRSFGMKGDGMPSPKMEGSLLYRLHSNGLVPGVEADRNRFKEVHRSKHGKVRIYRILSVDKASKEWVSQPENRACDAPGSWFCPGRYPPALQKILDQKQDFQQLEDFNKQTKDEDYQRQYFENLNNPEKARERAQRGDSSSSSSKKKKKTSEPQELTREQLLAFGDEWQDNDVTTGMWNLISSNQVDELEEKLQDFPAAAFVRSSDGRGPMFWAHEYGHEEIIELLLEMGVSDTDTQDKDGLRPVDLSKTHKKKKKTRA